jgi:hypothetical protein
MTPLLQASEWIARCWGSASGTLVAELAEGVEACDLFARLASVPGLLFLDSSPTGTGSVDERHGLARFSFLAADPLETLGCPKPDSTHEAQAVLADLARRLTQLTTPTIPGLPPFQGGYAGLLSYDHGLALLGQPVPLAAPATPSLMMPLYDVVFAFDHARTRGWLISQGFAGGDDAGGGDPAGRGDACSVGIATCALRGTEWRRSCGDSRWARGAAGGLAGDPRDPHRRELRPDGGRRCGVDPTR